MSEIIINQSVAILCDGNNIERSIHEMSKSKKAMINFDQLIPKLLNGRGLNRLIYFREGFIYGSVGGFVHIYDSAGLPYIITIFFSGHRKGIS